jgi:hypothetical protein
MNTEKVFPFEGIVIQSNLPSRAYTGDKSFYIYYFKNTSNEQFSQIKVTFEINLIAPSVKPVQELKFVYEKEYSIIEKINDKEELRHLLYECIQDAYEHYISQANALKLSYIDPLRMKVRSLEEEGPGFIIENY